MSSAPKKGEQQHNGPLLTLSAILKIIVLSAAEAEIGALFSNAKEGINIRNILKEIDHPQPATPMQTYNTTVHGIIRGSCKQQRSKAINMRFYWVRNCTQQGQYDIRWGPSAQKMLNYRYSHSRNPTCVRAHMHRHSQVLREPLSSEECWRVRTLSQYRT
jgi:hypothetical protein